MTVYNRSCDFHNRALVKRPSCLKLTFYSHFQARKLDHGFNGPVLAEKAEIRGKKLLILNPSILMFDDLCQVEEHSIQQWLQARDRIGFLFLKPATTKPGC